MFVFIVCYLKKEREMVWIWLVREVERAWEELGEGKGLIRIYWMKELFSNKKNSKKNQQQQKPQKQPTKQINKPKQNSTIQ